MSKRDFFRLLAAHHETPTAVGQALKDMRKAGWVQDRISITDESMSLLTQLQEELK